MSSGLFCRHWFDAWGQFYLPQGQLKGPTKHLVCTEDQDAHLPYVMLGPWGLRAISLAGYYAPFRTIPLSADKATQSAREIADKLGRERDIIAVRASPTSEGDPNVRAVFDALNAAGWQCTRRVLSCQYIVPLPGNAEVFRDTLSRNLRTTLNRNRNRALREGSFRIDRFTALKPDEWRRVIAQIAEIERHSWLVSHDYGATRFLGDRVQNFWLALLSDPALSTLASAWIAYVDEVPASFTFCLDDYPCRHYIACQYDERYSRLGLGWLVNEAMFESSKIEGFRTVNMGDGDKAYKSRWGAVEGDSLVERVAFRPGVRGGLAAFFFDRFLRRARS